MPHARRTAMCMFNRTEDEIGVILRLTIGLFVRCVCAGNITPDGVFPDPVGGVSKRTGPRREQPATAWSDVDPTMPRRPHGIIRAFLAVFDSWLLPRPRLALVATPRRREPDLRGLQSRIPR